MTIRAKLYAAIVLTILGPVATIAVALQGTAVLGERFDEVHARAVAASEARELKFLVTDLNGWQTAYGYDRGASRPQFLRQARLLREELAVASRSLAEPREQELLTELDREFDRFMRLDAIAYRALREGGRQRTKQILLGPGIHTFEDMAATADELAVYEERLVRATDREFDQERDDARRRLIAVALGAGIVIVLLILAAADIARMALEGQRARERSSGDDASDGSS